ncbi:MAG TPA: Ig-like domain-containing protein [Gallionellaceae bacterium]|nr:Ig-like domain-containing protein [Gallionellaceae bacterium]
MNTSDMSLTNAVSVAECAGTASGRTRGRGGLSVFNLLLMCALLAVALMASAVAMAAETIVSLTFDDGLTQSQVRSILLSHGMKATFYVNSNMIGQGSDYLTKAELDALYADGNEIGGHTIDHVDLATLSDAAQRAAICNDMQTLNTWYPGQIHAFAYPYASTGPTTQSILAAGCPGVGTYTSARTVGGLLSATDCPGCTAAEAIPPGNPYYVQTHESVLSTTTLAELKTWVTQAETNGGWVPLVFHRVCNGCGDIYAVTPATLDAFLTWLQARESNSTFVRTVNQVMTGVLPPPPPPPTMGSNLLVNPSLESDQDANSQADCWQRAGYGTNTATWTRTTDAHAGSFAEQLQVTAYSSGDRKLVTTLDTGQPNGGCAPPIEAGASYQLGAWYKSNTPVIPVLFYRDSGGVWQYWRDGPLLPASASWAQMTFLPGTPPSGAQNISFGIALDAVGTLTTDDYSLQKVGGTPDTTAPTVSLTAPAAGTVSGTVTVSASAADNVAVAGVQFRLDGANLASEVTVSPYSISWSTITATNGTHTLTAVARDAAGNTTTSTAVTVTVNNSDTTAPTVSLTAPAAGTITGTVAVSANAADNVGVAGVQFRLDGVNLGTEDTASPYSISWNTASATNGTHILTAVARDAAGNLTTSSGVTVTVSNLVVDTIPPTVALTAPAAGTVSGTVAVSANAADNVGVAGVQFRLDGVNLGTEATASPYSISWSTTTATNGTHTLTAVARDVAGNTATSTAVTVTVSNLSQNLVSNPSLELDANSNGIPDCWILGGYGTNTFVWTRVTSGVHSGNFAESLQVTSLSSGDRKLVQTQDSGACAPAVTPGARYTLSAWYKSTVPSAFVVFYRTSAGAWRYWTASPSVAATTNWTQAVYTTPAIPAGATHLSFGLYLSTVGTLVTDDYAMTLAP